MGSEAGHVNEMCIRDRYNTVLTTRDALNAAKAQLQVAEANLNIAQANLAVGSQTSLQYQSTLNTYTAAKNDVNTKQLQLLLALEDVYKRQPQT